MKRLPPAARRAAATTIAALVLLGCAMTHRPAATPVAPDAAPAAIATAQPAAVTPPQGATAPAAQPAATPEATAAAPQSAGTSLAATGAAPAGPAPTPSAGPAQAPSATTTPPAPPVPFEQAVARAGERLFSDARAALGDAPRELVIDPLIDAATGAQTFGTVRMGEQLAELVRREHRPWQVVPLTRVSLAGAPLLLIGTLTAVNTAPAADQPANAFRIWLTLVDLRTGRIVAKQLDRASVDSVNAEPTPYFRDSPTWHKDRTVAAYINSCQVNSKVGDPVDPTYLIRLPAAALLNEAIIAYSENRLAEARVRYLEAALVGDPQDLRVLNGLYLTNWRLGARPQAADAFAKIVAAGIASRQLPLKLLFTPATTNFLPDGDLREQYSLWLRELASRSSSGQACLKVVGHTSRTGSAALNDALSKRRAETVAANLQRQSRGLNTRLRSDGVGWRENLIGLGTDDLRDALDRRVEFRVVDCE